MEFVQFVKCVSTLHPVDDGFRCIRLQQSSAEGREEETDLNRLGGEISRSAARKRLENISSEILLSIMNYV